MLKNNQSNAPELMSALLERLTHAVLLSQGAAIPVTQEEVAVYDAHFPVTDCELPTRTPSFLYSWERADQGVPTAKVIPMDFVSIDQGLAMAARSADKVSLASRSKLARLMSESNNNGHAGPGK
jgi:hypothetical protein